MAKKKKADDTSAPAGPEIVLEASNGVRTIVPSPSGFERDRLHTIDGTVYEHVSDDEDGRWVYRAQ